MSSPYREGDSGLLAAARSAAGSLQYTPEFPKVETRVSQSLEVSTEDNVEPFGAIVVKVLTSGDRAEVFVNGIDVTLRLKSIDDWETLKGVVDRGIAEFLRVQSSYTPAKVAP